MYTDITLETSFGKLYFMMFQFSIWFKIYTFILWALVMVSNACCFVYIYRKLNLSNVVNLIPLLDCAMNLVGFIMIGIFSAILWCNAVASTAVGLFMCGE